MQLIIGSVTTVFANLLVLLEHLINVQ